MKVHQKEVEALSSHLILKNYSRATISAYGSALRQFLIWRTQQGMSGPFTQNQCREYLLYRYKQDLKWQTINGDYSALLKFYREVLQQDWDVAHIPRPRQEHSLPQIISEQEIKKLIENGLRFKHQVFMSLLYGTGLRLSESLNLKLRDIDGARLQIRVEKGKGAKDRYVFFPECLLDLLRSYYRVYRPVGYLFNGKVSGEPWSPRTAQWSIQSARDRIGMERLVSPHIFRHCYATHHLEKGTNLVYLKQQLGHKHLRTTAKYIHLCKAYQHQVYHPIASMGIKYHPTKV